MILKLTKHQKHFHQHCDLYLSVSHESRLDCLDWFNHNVFFFRDVNAFSKKEQSLHVHCICKISRAFFTRDINPFTDLNEGWKSVQAKNVGEIKQKSQSCMSKVHKNLKVEIWKTNPQQQSQTKGKHNFSENMVCECGQLSLQLCSTIADTRFSYSRLFSWYSCAAWLFAGLLGFGSSRRDCKEREIKIKASSITNKGRGEIKHSN